MTPLSTTILFICCSVVASAFASSQCGKAKSEDSEIGWGILAVVSLLAGVFVGIGTATKNNFYLSPLWCILFSTPFIFKLFFLGWSFKGLKNFIDESLRKEVKKQREEIKTLEKVLAEKDNQIKTLELENKALANKMLNNNRSIKLHL